MAAPKATEFLCAFPSLFVALDKFIVWPDTIPRSVAPLPDVLPLRLFEELYPVWLKLACRRLAPCEPLGLGLPPFM